MEEVCEWENCQQALPRVKANEESPGVDGMAVEQLPEYLNVEKILRQELAGYPEYCLRTRSRLMPLVW
jgi:hypothetical protein